jgi:hypothetical protein
MKYRVMWRDNNSSIWHTVNFDNEEKAIDFYNGLDCTEKNFLVKRRVGYSFCNI